MSPLFLSLKYHMCRDNRAVPEHRPDSGLKRILFSVVWYRMRKSRTIGARKCSVVSGLFWQVSSLSVYIFLWWLIVLSGGCDSCSLQKLLNLLVFHRLRKKLRHENLARASSMKSIKMCASRMYYNLIPYIIRLV